MRQAVLGALESIEILGGTVREAMGYGRQKNRLHRYLGSEYDGSFLPKVEITVVVHEQDVAAASRPSSRKHEPAGWGTVRSWSSHACRSI